MSLIGSVLLRATAPGAVKRFDRASRAPIESQHRLLREILGANADSAYGRRHGFGDISTFRGARKYIPMTRVRARLPHHAQAHPVDVHGALCGVLC